MQQALNAAAATSGADEVRVAAGTYQPSARTDAADPRSATFGLQNNVRLLGGYANGGGMTRDSAANVATLSGDIGTAGSASDNTYHVVTAGQVDATAVLDGFTVTGGNAGDGAGGGMDNGGSPTLINCTFGGNSGGRGGAIFNSGNLTLTNCTFNGNSASSGGGMYQANRSSSTLTECTFIGNSAGRGGGLYHEGGEWRVEGASPTLTSCTFIGNSADEGGGIYNGGGVAEFESGVGASPGLTNCAFIGNSAQRGGGMFNAAGGYSDGAAPTLTNCTFTGNSAEGGGGAIYSDFGSSPTATNCIFWGNSSERGGAQLAGGSPARHSLIEGGWTAAGPGAFLPTANENYTQRVDTRNIDYMTHALEALLTLDEITPAAHPRKAGLAAQVTNIGNFITTRMYRDAPGSTTTGYLPWNYDPAWNPDPDPALRYSTPGHNFEVAFLLSRAMERGFNPAWLGVASKLVAYTLRYGFDNAPASPTYGAVPHGKLAFDGTRFEPAPPELVWWQQAEAARALLHFAAVRGRNDLWDEYDAASAFIGSRFVDPVYGGWFTHLDPFTLAPTTADKGTVWTGGYHETMLDAERLRVATADGAQSYEAEQAAVTGAAVSSSHPGFSGTGYVDYAHAGGDSVEFAVTAPAAGPYELRFRYANGGTADRAMGLAVNGVAVPGGVTFARTGSWRAWGEVAVTVPLAAGVNRVRLDATGQSGPNLDALFVRAAPPPAVTYQAEAARLSGPLALSNVPGYTGSGFADYQNRIGDYAEFAVDVPAGGTWALDFRYANGSTTDRPLELTVDERVLTGRLSFAPTGGWGTWKTSTRPAVLAAGRHTVRLTAVGSSGPNLDALTVTAAPAPPAEPVTLQAEDAALSGPRVARGNGGYTGTGYADYERASGDYVEFVYDAPSAGEYALSFRYANGSASDRPLELVVNGAAQGGVSFAPTGSWSTWRTATASVSLPAGTSRIRLAAAGSGGPNLDSLTVTPAGTARDVVYLSQGHPSRTG